MRLQRVWRVLTMVTQEYCGVGRIIREVHAYNVCFSIQGC